MNKTIKVLLFSDIFIVTGTGLIQPILSIYFNQNIQGSTIFNIGLASTIYLVIKSLIQLPFSRYVDRQHNKIKWLIIGTFLSILVPFIYIFSKNMQMIYFAQVLQGIGSGLAFPCWLGLWSANIDKNNRSYEWSLYATLTGIGTAISAAIGGAIAEYVGFNYTFILVGLLSLIGGILLFSLEKKAEHKQRKLTQYFVTK